MDRNELPKLKQTVKALQRVGYTKRQAEYILQYGFYNTKEQFELEILRDRILNMFK